MGNRAVMEKLPEGDERPAGMQPNGSALDRGQVWSLHQK